MYFYIEKLEFLTEKFLFVCVFFLTVFWYVVRLEIKYGKTFEILKIFNNLKMQ